MIIVLQNAPNSLLLVPTYSYVLQPASTRSNLITANPEHYEVPQTSPTP